MLSRFKENLKHLNLVQHGKTILLAVSGGLDSMVMFHLFRKSGVNFSVAHCNFNLRGTESQQDAEFIKEICKKNKIRFHHKKFNTEEYSAKNKISIQEAARNLRYDFFESLLLKDNYFKIATAHHLDDSIETFFINLIRGTGIQGLAGIREERENIIRPLSTFGRNEILAYAKQEGIRWREDSSNKTEIYLRNRVRKKLIPVFLDLQPEFREIMKRNMDLFAKAAGLQSETLSQLTKKYLKKKGKDSRILNIKGLAKEENAVYKCGLLLQSIGISANAAESMMKTEVPGKYFYSGGYRILRDRSELIITKSEQASGLSLKVSRNDRFIEIQGTQFELGQLAFLPGAEFIPGKNLQELDASKLHFPLTLRTWKSGDFFYPLGLGGRKKVSDYLIDRKINRLEKENCYVLLSGKDIVCILGHRIDDRYKVTEKTKEIYSIQLNNQS